MTIESKIQYRGFTIVLQSYPSRFGTGFTAHNDYGEPYADIKIFSSAQEALEWDKKNLDQLIDEN